MNVRDICQRKVVTIDPSDGLLAAAQCMRDRHVGYLVVTELDAVGVSKPTGVLTDRDIVITVVAREVDPRSLRVGDVMTRHPITAADTDSVASTLERMRTIGVRRLPIVGDRGQLVGVLSLDDVLNGLAGELQSVVSSIRHEQRVECELRP